MSMEEREVWNDRLAKPTERSEEGLFTKNKVFKY